MCLIVLNHPTSYQLAFSSSRAANSVQIFVIVCIRGTFANSFGYLSNAMYMCVCVCECLYVVVLAYVCVFE